MTPEEQKELDRLAAIDGPRLIQQLRADKPEQLLDAQGKPMPASATEKKAAAEFTGRRRNELLAKERARVQAALYAELRQMLEAKDEISDWFLVYGVGQHLQAYAEMSMASSAKIPMDKLRAFFMMYAKLAESMVITPQFLLSGLAKITGTISVDAARYETVRTRIYDIRKAYPGFSTVSYGAVTPEKIPLPSATYVVGEAKDRTDFMAELRQVYEASGIKTATFSMDSSGVDGIIPRQWWVGQGTTKESMLAVIKPMVEVGRHVLFVPNWELFLRDPSQQHLLLQLLELGLVIFMGIDSAEVDKLHHCITVGRDKDGRVVSEYMSH
jgi:hypothetical protein